MKLMNDLLDIFDKSEMTYEEFGDRSGLAKSTLYHWRGRRHKASLAAFNDALGVFGKTLKIVDIEK